MTDPYRPPATEPQPRPLGPVEDRRAHRRWEARVVLLGWAYAVFGILGLLSAPVLGMLVLPANVQDLGVADQPALVGVGMWMAASTLLVVAGAGMVRLRPWGRWAGMAGHLGMVMSCLGAPIGLWGVVLHLGARGRRVFAPDYAALVAATPQVAWRMHWPTLLWMVPALGFYGLLMLALVA